MVQLKLIFTQNHLSQSNVQNLAIRINDMTEQGSNYWKGKTEYHRGETKDISNTGITTMKK